MSDRRGISLALALVGILIAGQLSVAAHLRSRALALRHEHAEMREEQSQIRNKIWNLEAHKAELSKPSRLVAIATKLGLRLVHDPEAICWVPRAGTGEEAP